VATALAHPEHFDRFGARPWLWPLPVLALGAAAVAWRSLSLGAELKAFLASCAFIVTLLAATAGTLYPVLLRSTVEARYSLTAHNASSPRGSLAVGLALLAPALVLAVGYFTYLYRSFRGKVEAEGAGSH
jgi:cytochrome d ubiquinol oxidase subunit II